jgi:hypothetical protein
LEEVFLAGSVANFPVAVAERIVEVVIAQKYFELAEKLEVEG